MHNMCAPKTGSGVFAESRTTWSATRSKGTGQTYGVTQRTDINWQRVRTSGDARFVGKTNAEAARKGLAPQLDDGNLATLHHVGQHSRGPLVEASRRYHGVGKPGHDSLHGQFGRSKPHPTHPVDHKKFGVDTREYWKWRVDNP